jgi:hypothetical protein
MKSTFWRERYMSHPGDQLSDAGLNPVIKLRLCIRDGNSRHLALLELASNTLLDIEGGVMSRPCAIMCQLEVVSTYDFRNDLLDLGHGNLNLLASVVKNLGWSNKHSFPCIAEYQHQTPLCSSP